MRKQFVTTVEDLMRTDPRVALLLGDIGVFAFRKAFAEHQDRTFNIGICEQAMTSLAAGFAKEGLIPIIHSIAPFVVERCLEQIKVDLCYQKLAAKIVSVGGSYDYSSLGCTHHCPADVAVLKTIPSLQIVVPGNAVEFDALLRESYGNGATTYYRISETLHTENPSVTFGKATLIKRGERGVVIAVGPFLSRVLEASQGLDVTILYYTTLAPFDHESLADVIGSGAVALVAPFYEETLVSEIFRAAPQSAVRVLSIGVPHRFLTYYGKVEDMDRICGLSTSQIALKLTQFFS